MATMLGNGGGATTPAAATAGSTLAGSKRRADDSNLCDSERFAKRFNLLNIGSSSSNYYIPISKPASRGFASTSFSHASITTNPQDDDDDDDEDDLMQVDDTSDRVYIHDLDSELADIESSSDDEKLVFLPDIEKRLSKIPQHILRSDGGGGGGREDESQELVLYHSVPKSLTTDAAGSESVRKAIVESRQRARMKAVEEARQLDMDCKYGQSPHVEAAAETAHGYGAGYGMMGEDLDPDAMDVD